LGIKKKLTTAYHPQANGLVERLHRRLKEALRSREAGVQWEDHLPWVLLGLRAAPRDDMGVLAAETTLGVQLTLPGQLLEETAAAAGQLAQELRADRQLALPVPLRPRSYAQAAAAVPGALEEAEWVFVRKGGVSPPLAAKFDRPYQVISKSEKYFVIKVGDKLDSVSVDRLKSYRGGGVVTPAVPPLRGRPPKLAAPAGSSGSGG
jgi:hypothetical protein